MTVAAPVENFRLAVAQRYAARGWLIVPLHWIKQSPTSNTCSCGKSDCSSPGKHPITKNGLKDASTDPAQLASWWGEKPGANVGIVTGAVSGIVVVDVDSRHNGFDTLEAIIHEHGDQDTLEVATGGGGVHLFYQHPGVPIKNSSGKIGLGVDVRGDGGYVVAPPSGHTSGKRYAWNPDKKTLAPMPRWLLELLIEKPRPAEPATPRLDDTATHWLGKALAKASFGNRNETGLWLACQLRDNGIRESDADGTMRDYAARCPHGDTPYTEREALATLKSAFSEPARQPSTSGEKPAGPSKQAAKPSSNGAAAELNAYMGRIIRGEVVNVPFSGDWLTYLTNALIPGSITTVCGDPGVGKTFWILDNLKYWVGNDHNPAVFFVEKDRKFHSMRMLAQLEGSGKYVDFKWIAQNGDAVEIALERNHALIDLLGQHVFSATEDDINFDMMLGWLKEQAQGGRRVIVVDPITIVDAGRERWLVDDAFIRKSQKVIGEYGCSLILVTHPKPGSARLARQTGHDQAGGAAYFRFVDTTIRLHKTQKPRQVQLKHGPGLHTCKLDLFAQLHKTRNGKGGGAEIGMTFGEGLRFVEQGVVLKDVPDKEEEGAE